jgi:hypothetical protein
MPEAWEFYWYIALQTRDAPVRRPDNRIFFISGTRPDTGFLRCRIPDIENG